MRLPIRQIQMYLLTLHRVAISSGEIVELLHRMKAQMQPQLDALKTEIRASPAVQADETGWREDESLGYIWSVSTPSVRYDEYHHSRAGAVIKQLIGEDFGGVLGSDFYVGYTIHQGLHQQRCWVHFLRDAHELKEQQARVAQQHAYAQDLWHLCQPYVRTATPQHTLCERVERFLPELFVFVAVPGVPAHNNLAERSVRPLVIARKISGGTRSPK